MMTRRRSFRHVYVVASDLLNAIHQVLQMLEDVSLLQDQNESDENNER